MKLRINEEEYELTEECQENLLQVLKQVALRAELPKELTEPIETLRLDEDHLRATASQLRENGLAYYHNLPTPVRLIAIQATRWIIARLEMRIESREARELLRPPKRKDPIEHLIDVFYPVIEHSILPEIAKIRDATITCTTQDNTITKLTFSQDSTG